MVRSIWRKTLVTSLAWAGMAWAQQPQTDSVRPLPASPTQGAAERVFTVREQGKPAQKCKVLRTWKTPEGANAYQVLAVETGEIMTIVESGPVTTVPGAAPGTRTQAIATRIFHWGRSQESPAGVPAPPMEIVRTTQTQTVIPWNGTSTTPMTTMPMTTTGPVSTAPMVTNGPVMTQAPAPEQKTGLFYKLFHHDETPVVQQAPTVVTVPAKQYQSVETPVAQQKPASSGPLARWFHRDDTAVVPQKPTTGEAPAKVAAAKKPSQYDMTSEYDAQQAGKSTPSLVKVMTPEEEAQHAAELKKKEAEQKKLAEQQRLEEEKKLAERKKLDEQKKLAEQKKLEEQKRLAEQKKLDEQQKVAAQKKAADEKTSAWSDWRKSWGRTDEKKPVETKVTVQTTLPAADSKRADPLLQLPPAYAPKQAVVPTENQDTAAKPAAATTTSQALAPAQGPVGSQSVMGANEGAPGAVQYIPVPVVTMPDMTHPPMPPNPHVPSAPNPVARQYDGMSNTWANAQNKALGPNPTTNDEGLVNAFTSMPSPEQMAKSTNAFGSPEPGSMASLQGMARPPQQGMMAAPRYPVGMVAQNVPPAGMQGYGMAGVQPASYQAAGQYQQQMLAAQNLQQMQLVLRDSLYPSQREWAAESLATLDWRSNPQVVQALLTAAKDDPAATVRAACVHCLGKMKVNTVPVVTTVESLKADPDPRVRHAVDEAMASLKVTR
jgi:hypothetical protein